MTSDLRVTGWGSSENNPNLLASAACLMSKEEWEKGEEKKGKEEESGWILGNTGSW